MKKNFEFRRIGFVWTISAMLFLIWSTELAAQVSQVSVPVVETESEDFTWWYLSLFVLLIALGAAVAWRMKTKKLEKEVVAGKESSKRKNNMWETGSLDADEELEWLRKNQKLIDKKRKNGRGKNKSSTNTPSPVEASGVEEVMDSQQLPVFKIQGVNLTKPFSPLPLSNDEALLSAIEQTHDEYEEDEEVRDLAVRILTAFKTRNSVEALSEVALYDLSSNLRSKAVLILTEFDHEAVFETILLACADPTREVRAAAARGITRLSFDRAEAWARITETREEGRIRQAARAAIESGFVERSLERLVHTDQQYAYEAFVLLMLLVKAGETEIIFNALKTHKNIVVREAIIHLLKISKDKTALKELDSLLEDKKLPEELRNRVNKTVAEGELVAV